MLSRLICLQKGIQTIKLGRRFVPSGRRFVSTHNHQDEIVQKTNRTGLIIDMLELAGLSVAFVLTMNYVKQIRQQRIDDLYLEETKDGAIIYGTIGESQGARDFDQLRRSQKK